MGVQTQGRTDVSVRRLVLVVIAMIFASNGLRESIDAAIDVLAQQQRLQLQRTMLVFALAEAAPDLLPPCALRSSGCGVYICCVCCTYLPVHQTRRSAAGSRSHASLDQRAVVVCGPCLRSAGTSAKQRSSALSQALTCNTPREVYWRMRP